MRPASAVALTVAALAITVLARAAAQPPPNNRECGGNGDVILRARTPQVDLYDAAAGKRLRTLDGASFPQCLPISARAPNMMLQVRIGGHDYWVPPHMVFYRVRSPLAICRNLATGDNQTGATRNFGQSCPSYSRSAPTAKVPPPNCPVDPDNIGGAQDKRCHPVPH